jgi:hypothetical protein
MSLLPVGVIPLSGYNINNSLRFRSSASASLSKTFSSLPTVRTKQTFSLWVKRGSLGSQQRLIDSYDGSSSWSQLFYFTSSNTLQLDFGGSAQNALNTTQVFRDPSAWYHIVLAIDTTQATASNRVKFYVNGSQITTFGTANYPAQNALCQFLGTSSNRIGSNYNNTTDYFDGYMAEVNFIDGQTLTPSSFGETDTTTGVWKPAKYTGTYGINGFYLPFTDNTGTSRNYLTYSQLIGGTSWSNNTLTVSTNSIVAPDGSTTASTLTGTGGDSYTAGTFTTVASNTYTLSVWLKSTSNISVAILAGPPTWSITTCNLTTSWQRFSVTFTANGTTSNAIIGGNGSITSGTVVHAWGAQVNDGSTATPYYATIASAQASTFLLGRDYSSGGYNNWVSNNLSLTAGVTYDSMTDVPTLTSATASNYCVLNPIDRLTTATLSNANLAFTTATTGHNAIGSIGMSSGDYYWEAQTSAGTTQARATVYGTAASTYYSFAANNTVYGFRFDADAGTLDYTTDGSSFTSLATGLTSGPYFPYFNNNGTTSKTISVNFGQRPFTYTPPTGYKRLNTFNLPDSTIKKGNSYMDATTYTGTGASLSVTNAAGFRPDFVWVKGRSGATAHALYDFVRGTTKDLVSNSTAAETTQAQGLTAFNSNGFTVGTLAKMNTNAATYVGWQWVGSNSSVSNTSGTITSTVDANTTAGFSIVTYTGIGTAGTVGHGLGVAPKFVIVKPRSSANSWVVWTTALTGSQYLLLQQTDAVGTSSTTWNATVPTSTVFSVGLNDSSTNANGVTHVAYCWSEIAGFSKFGSYTGNGSADGPFVYTGFTPKFILIRNRSAANNWNIFDSTRDPFNVVDLSLQPNLSTAEFTEADLDILSNGFKLRVTNAGLNGNTNTLIYMAFAENPFKNSLAR